MKFEPATGEPLRKWAKLYDVLPRAGEADDALRARVLQAMRGERKTIFGTGLDVADPKLIEGGL